MDKQFDYYTQEFKNNTKDLNETGKNKKIYFLAGTLLPTTLYAIS
jgi:hypothetical protein